MADITDGMMTEKSVGQELVELVEADLGHAHISDHIEELPPDRVFDIARGSLKHIDIAARKIRRFLKRHGQSE